MEEKINRIKTLLGDDAFEDKKDPVEPVKSPESGTQRYDYRSDPDEDEVATNWNRRIGGRLEHTVRKSQNVKPTVAFPAYNLQVGEQIQDAGDFCPLNAIAKYPYEHISAALRNIVVNRFFAKGMLYERTWDIFYIYVPKAMGNKSILLVPHYQVLHFFTTINSELKTSFNLPPDSRENGLIVSFPLDGTPRPRYIGRSTESEMAEGVKKAVPSFSWRPDSELEADPSGPEATEDALRAFKEKIELILENDQKKKRASKEKRTQLRAQRMREWKQDVRRLQTYLGFITESYAYNYRYLPPNIASLSFQGPAPYPLDPSMAPIFLAVDIESYERQHTLITEIGIATLDTTEIYPVAPGLNGTNWYPFIRARHLRIKEYAHLINRDFVAGCPEYFDFGESEFISIKEAPRTVAACFREPFLDPVWRAQSQSQKPPAAGIPSVAQWNATIAPERRRPLILVGHSLSSDLRYLKQMGYDPSNHASVDLNMTLDTSTLDVAMGGEGWNRKTTNTKIQSSSTETGSEEQSVQLSQTTQRELEQLQEQQNSSEPQASTSASTSTPQANANHPPQPRSLASLLSDLGLSAYNLHNAGNDAVWTMRALLGLGVKSMEIEVERARRERERLREERRDELRWNSGAGGSTGGDGWGGGNKGGEGVGAGAEGGGSGNESVDIDGVVRGWGNLNLGETGRREDQW